VIYVLYALGAIGIIIVAFLLLGPLRRRWAIVSSVEWQRDKKLIAVLNPIARRLQKKEPVTADEIAKLSRQPQYRPQLYRMLESLEQLDLFPANDLSIEAQGEGVLAYWLMHPDKMNDAPAQIELVEGIERDLEGLSRLRPPLSGVMEGVEGIERDLTDRRGKFLVYRYRMPPGHPAEKDGWLLGFAGPFFDNDRAYSSVGFYARYDDKYGEVKPSELVDRQLASGKAVAALASIAPGKKVRVRHDVGFGSRH
jgi:hypothetical protein